MKKLLVLAITLLVCFIPLQGEAARGFGATLGVGTTDRIVTTYATSPAGQVSYSARIWINGTGGSGGGRLFAKGTNSTTVDRISAPGALQLNEQFSTAAGQWATTATLSSGIWHSVVITYDASTTANVPIFYVDGAVSASTQTVAPVGTRTTTATAYSIGNSSDGTRNFDGKIAEFAIWNGVILNASEALALSRGVSPFNIRNASLSLFLPLYGNNAGEQDWSSAHATQTLTGTAFQAHPPVRPAFWGK